MIVETERLILREYTLEDFDALYEILSDKETTVSYAYAITRNEWEKLKD